MVYEVEMTETYRFRVKANDKNVVQDWLQFHNVADLKSMTSDFREKYVDKILKEMDDSERFAIDITEPSDEDPYIAVLTEDQKEIWSAYLRRRLTDLSQHYPIPAPEKGESLADLKDAYFEWAEQYNKGIFPELNMELRISDWLRMEYGLKPRNPK